MQTISSGAGPDDKYLQVVFSMQKFKFITAALSVYLI